MTPDVDLEDLRFGTDLIKRGFARMQKGGVVMDVTDATQAGIAEDAGAVAVMALERVPADIRAHGGVARMADPAVIEGILDAVTIPVMAKCRIGHLVEAQILESLGVDMIDESEVLTPTDPFFHVDKRGFTVPFVCGTRDLPEAVRRVFEGAAMIRTKGEAGTGNVVEAVRHRRIIARSIEALEGLDEEGLQSVAGHIAERYAPLVEATRDDLGLGGADATADVELPAYLDRGMDEVTTGLYEVLAEVRKLGRLPVVDFAAGGVATPADAALMMRLGSDGVFVGSGIFKSNEPEPRARAIVEAVTHFDDPEVLAEVSKGLGEAMVGIDISDIPEGQRMQERGD